MIMKTNRLFKIMMLALMMVSGCIAAWAQAREKLLTPQEQELIELSNQKWQWMADKNVEKLRPLFHENAMFVHMGGSWGKEAELNTIEKGFIWYKHADIHSQEVKFANETGIVYSNIHLTSEVGGREVTFPFMVSEVYVKEGSRWQLAALIFTRLMEANRQSNTE